MLKMKSVYKFSIMKKRWPGITTNLVSWFIPVLSCRRKCKELFLILTVKQEQNHERKQIKRGCTERL